MNVFIDSFFTVVSPSLLWFTIGFLFLLSELVLPSAIVFFFGFGAWTTALVIGALELTVTSQLTTFLISSLLYLLILRKTVVAYIESKTGVDPYSIEDDLIGKIVTVTETISPPQNGKVLVNGTHWTALASTHIESGASVRIVSRESITLTVSAL